MIYDWDGTTARNAREIEGINANDTLGYSLAISANGTGPFKVEEFRQGEYWSLIKNNDYWNNKKANIDRLKIVIMPDEASIVAGLKSGQIHATIFEDARIAELLKRSSIYINTM